LHCNRYEDGKFLKKKNTFTDFIACAEHLIQAGISRQLGVVFLTTCMRQFVGPTLALLPYSCTQHSLLPSSCDLCTRCDLCDMSSSQRHRGCDCSA
jgi:hypothetical protein